MIKCMFPILYYNALYFYYTKNFKLLNLWHKNGLYHIIEVVISLRAKLIGDDILINNQSAQSLQFIIIFLS